VEVVGGRLGPYFEDFIVRLQSLLIVFVELILASTYLVTLHIKIFVDLQMSKANGGNSLLHMFT
jgi:hypothetical protein